MKNRTNPIIIDHRILIKFENDLYVYMLNCFAAHHFGSLVLCPPGGQSFATAYTMACEMKKRRRKKKDLGKIHVINKIISKLPQNGMKILV